jgi:ComEC/Rec2-related protein
MFKNYSRIYFLPEDQEFLLKGLIFGDDSQLSLATKKLFQGLGLSHFTAASGANLRLFLPEWLLGLRLFRFVPVFMAWELLGVALYLKLAAFSPSLWRASLFWFVRWLGQLLGRKHSTFLLLAEVLLLTFLFKKEYFGFLSFQLSFLCMVALYFSQIKNNYENTLRESFTNKYFVCIRESLRESLIIFIFLSPLLYYSFGVLAPIGVIGTVVLSPVLQVFTQLGLASLLFTDLFPLESFKAISYAFIRGIFFILWFVDTSALHIAVWCFVLISIALLGLQMWKRRSVWRELQ